MRKSALATATLALASFATTAAANDDFSALLADLTFGNAPTLNEPLAVAEESVGELRPVPTGITMPEMVESSAPAQKPTEFTLPVAKAEPVVAPKVALQDPIPATQPKAVEEVDLDAAFALQDPPQIKAAKVPSTPVGHHVPQNCTTGCEVNYAPTVITCRPRTPVHLPSSTLLQYFRSDACYTNVWDGYNRNCSNHKHLHGDCDCFKNGNCGDCDSCDAGCGH